ncbi:hypothetical protein HDV57DRAFT_296976 [Trichoderma longibrachiatum]
MIKSGRLLMSCIVAGCLLHIGKRLDLSYMFHDFLATSSHDAGAGNVVVVLSLKLHIPSVSRASAAQGIKASGVGWKKKARTAQNKALTPIHIEPSHRDDKTSNSFWCSCNVFLLFSCSPCICKRRFSTEIATHGAKEPAEQDRGYIGMTAAH